MAGIIPQKRYSQRKNKLSRPQKEKQVQKKGFVVKNRCEGNFVLYERKTYGE